MRSMTIDIIVRQRETVPGDAMLGMRQEWTSKDPTFITTFFSSSPSEVIASTRAATSHGRWEWVEGHTEVKVAALQLIDYRETSSPTTENFPMRFPDCWNPVNPSLWMMDAERCREAFLSWFPPMQHCRTVGPHFSSWSQAWHWSFTNLKEARNVLDLVRDLSEFVGQPRNHPVVCLPALLKRRWWS